MNTVKLLLGAMLASGLLAATAAARTNSTALPEAPRPRLPAPVKIVHPTGLPLRFKDATVRLVFTIDETGTPHDIAPVDRMPDDLKARLLPAVAGWKFTPMYEDGRPVPVRVMLPLKLVEEP